MSTSGKIYDEASKARDNIKRGAKEPNLVGTATFFGFRAADPFLQYSILAHNSGSTVIEKLGGTVLPQGPPLVTNTPWDRLGLSPYRSILLGMSIGSMLKQNFHLTVIMQEEMPPVNGAVIGLFNAVCNSLNSLFFICSQTSASVNGEHYPQTPLIVGSTLYTAGLFIEWFSEVQRHVFKKDPKNKGKVYTGGLFGVSRHINYLGYTMWRSGYALAAGGWVWGSIVGAFFTYDFCSRGIPVLQKYLEERVGLPCIAVTEVADLVCSTASNTRSTSVQRRTSLCLSFTDEMLRACRAGLRRCTIFTPRVYHSRSRSPVALTGPSLVFVRLINLAKTEAIMCLGVACSKC